MAYVGGKRNRFDYYRVDRMENITKPLGIEREGKGVSKYIIRENSETM